MRGNLREEVDEVRIERVAEDLPPPHSAAARTDDVGAASGWRTRQTGASALARGSHGRRDSRPRPPAVRRALFDTALRGRRQRRQR